MRPDGEDEGQLEGLIDHSDLRAEIKKAMDDLDEVTLSAAIDVAHELGGSYPFKDELEQAENFLMDLVLLV